jgi:ABC-type glutathione transport system ATPase component
VDGELLFQGQDLLSMPAKQRAKLRGGSMGLIFQEPMTRLNPLLKVSAHFDEALKAHENLSRRQRRERGLEALRALGVPPTRYDTYPHEFSGGMRQRVMIALATASQPRLLLADEPTGQLDSETSLEVVNLLREAAASGITVLLATHDAALADAADRVLRMEDGRLT